MFDEIEALCLLSNSNLPFSGKFWWGRYPKRAAEEIYKMSENTCASMYRKSSKLIFKEEIYNDFGTAFCISIEVGTGFPFKIPDVYVEDCDVDISVVPNCYNNGKLCLINPNLYNTQMTILEIRNLAVAWCQSVEVFFDTGVWPAAEGN